VTELTEGRGKHKLSAPARCAPTAGTPNRAQEKLGAGGKQPPRANNWDEQYRVWG